MTGPTKLLVLIATGASLVGCGSGDAATEEAAAANIPNASVSAPATVTTPSGNQVQMVDKGSKPEDYDNAMQVAAEQSGK